MNHQSKVHKSLMLAVFAIAVAASPVMAGADLPVLTVTKASRISVHANNEPLNALLRLLAEKRLCKVSGGVAGDESLTVHFANLTLPEVLPKLLRGYNYVVIEQGKHQLPVLAVMGKIEKGASAVREETAAPAAVVPDQRSYAPQEPVLEPPAPPAAPPPTAQPAARQPQAPQEARLAGEAGGQPAQQAPGGQPPPPVQAPPAESPGVKF